MSYLLCAFINIEHSHFKFYKNYCLIYSNYYILNLIY